MGNITKEKGNLTSDPSQVNMPMEFIYPLAKTICKTPPGGFSDGKMEKEKNKKPQDIPDLVWYNWVTGGEKRRKKNNFPGPNPAEC